MRYKIEKIAKRNNLKYEVVEYWGGLKGYEFSADSYREKSFLESFFRAKDLHINSNPYSYCFTVMYLDDYLKLKNFSKMQSKLVNMFCQAMHDGKTATEAKNIQLHFCALCPEYFPAYENIYNEVAWIQGGRSYERFNRDFKGYKPFYIMPCYWLWWFVFIFLLICEV